MCECVLYMLCWLGNVKEYCVVGVISCQGIILPHLIHYVLNNTTAQKEKRNIPMHYSTYMHMLYSYRFYDKAITVYNIEHTVH